MAVSDYSADPNQNNTIGGINIAENCPAANLNNALRYFMADVKVAFNGIGNTGNYMPTAGGVFTGNPTYSGQGGYMRNAAAGSIGGAWFTQNGGTPSGAGMAEGDWLAVLA